jgi:hypothetical protein
MRQDRAALGTARAGALDWLVGLGLALAALAVYSRTLAPGLGGTMDSAEFQQAAARLALVHTTGYPLYLLLARGAIVLIPFGSPAFRVTLLSALFGAAAVAVLYALVRLVTRRRGAALAAAALFAVQPIPWATAGVAEINTLNTLLIGAMFLAAVAWAERRVPGWVVAGAIGLAVSHHRTALLYVPLILLWLVWAARRVGERPRGRPDWRSVAAAGLAAGLPFAAYLYVPLRAATAPWYENSWRGFFNEVLGNGALPVIAATLSRPLGPRLDLIFGEQAFRGPAGWALLGLGLLGLLAGGGAWRSHRATAPDAGARQVDGVWLPALALCAVAAGVGFAFAVAYDIIDVSDYLAVPLLLWSVPVGAGLAAIQQAVARLVGAAPPVVRWAGRLALVGAVALLWVFTATSSLARQDVRVDYSTVDRLGRWQTIEAQPLPPNTMLIGDSLQVNEALYVQQVEGWRPDVRIFLIDDVLAGNTITQWLAEGRPIYLLGPYDAVVQQYQTEQRGPLWHVTGLAGAAAHPALAHPLGWRYGDSIILRGYTLAPDPPLVAPGEDLRVTLYWQATARIFARYTVFNHLVGAQGTMAGQQDDEPGRGFHPTIIWQPGELITDTFTIAIHADAAPGSYRLMSGFYDQTSLQRLPAVAADGAALSDYPQLTVITIK